MKNSSFQFNAPVLSHLDFTLNNDFNRDEKSHFKNDFQVGYNKNEDGREAIVELSVTIGVPSESQNQPFSVKLVIGSVFRWNDDFSEEFVESLLTINAPALLVSYARPIVASITNSSGCGTYNIPFIDFTDRTRSAVPRIEE